MVGTSSAIVEGAVRYFCVQSQSINAGIIARNPFTARLIGLLRNNI